MIRLKIVQFTNAFFRYSIAGIFGYFGYLAVTDPVIQTQIWINPDVYGLIINFLPVEQFMRIFGAAQIGVAILIFLNRFLQIVYPIAAVMLIGIIINLGFNEVTYRDVVILAGVLYLWSQEI